MSGERDDDNKTVGLGSRIVYITFICFFIVFFFFTLVQRMYLVPLPTITIPTTTALEIGVEFATGPALELITTLRSATRWSSRDSSLLQCCGDDLLG